MFGLERKRKEFADMMVNHLAGWPKKGCEAQPFLVYLRTVREIFGLEIMAQDYLNTMENHCHILPKKTD